MFRMLAIGSVALLATSAWSADVPSYPVGDWCEMVSQSVGGSYVIKQGCIEQENDARSEVQRMPSTPDRIHGWCDRVATQGTGSSGSYQIYLGCVQQELEAAR